VLYVQNRRFRFNAISVDPKSPVNGLPPPTIFPQKTRLNDLSYGIKIWTYFCPFYHNALIWQRDGQTDRQTGRILIARPRLHFMQRRKNKQYRF